MVLLVAGIIVGLLVYQGCARWVHHNISSSIIVVSGLNIYIFKGLEVLGSVFACPGPTRQAATPMKRGVEQNPIRMQNPTAFLRSQLRLICQ